MNDQSNFNSNGTPGEGMQFSQNPQGGVPQASNGAPQAPYGVPQTPQKSSDVGLGEWMWTLLVASIPLVGFVMMFVFAFASEKKSKRSFFQAALIWSAIGLVLGIVMMVGMFSMVFSLFGALGELGEIPWDVVFRM